ncbi:hypothetical protein IJ556_05390 [bacterium]|nr:hypothetical protein [bacterium]
MGQKGQNGQNGGIYHVAVLSFRYKSLLKFNNYELILITMVLSVLMLSINCVQNEEVTIMIGKPIFAEVHNLGCKYTINLMQVRYLMSQGDKTLIQFVPRIVCGNDPPDDWYQYLDSQDRLVVDETIEKILNQTEDQSVM